MPNKKQRSRVEITAELLERARLKEGPALAALVDFTYGCVELFLGETGCDTQDVAELAFNKVIRALEAGAFDSGRRAKASSWVTRITVNTVYDHIRRTSVIQRRNRTIRLGDVPMRLDELLEEKEITEHLQRELSRLDPDDQALLFARFYAGLSVKETAELLGKPEGTIKSSTWRLVGELREQFLQRGLIEKSTPFELVET